MIRSLFLLFQVGGNELAGFCGANARKYRKVRPWSRRIRPSESSGNRGGPPTLTLLYRIHVEETALRAAFGEEYVAYSRKTKRLIPGVY